MSFVALTKNWAAMYYSFTQIDVMLDPYMIEYLAIITGRTWLVQSI